MFHSMKSASLLGICALAFSACSSVAVREGAVASAATTIVTDSVPVATLAPAVALPAPVASPVGSPSRDGRSVRPSTVQALGQLVTTQALLVSLLLAPLSKDSASQPMARADGASTHGSPLR